MTLYGAADGNTGKFESGEYIFLGRSDTSGFSYYAERTESDLSPDKNELMELFKLQ